MAVNFILDFFANNHNVIWEIYCAICLMYIVWTTKPRICVIRSVQI